MKGFKNLLGKISILSLILLSTISSQLIDVNAAASNMQVGLTVNSHEQQKLPDSLVKAINQTLITNSAKVFPGTKFEISSIRNLNSWYLIFIVSLDGPFSGIDYEGVADAGKLLIANLDDTKTWQVGLEGTTEFVNLVNISPSSFLVDESKRNLTDYYVLQKTVNTNTVSSNSVVTNTAIQGVNYKFPWDNGVARIWAIRDGNIWHGWHCTHTDYCAIDMLTSGSDKKVLAASNGTVTLTCSLTSSYKTVNIIIKDADGKSLEYWHVDRTSVDGSKIYTGAFVAQGSVLGNSYSGSFSGDCGDANAQQAPNAAHIHFVLPKEPITIDNWEFAYPSTCATNTVTGESRCAGSSFISTNQSGAESSCIPPSSGNWQIIGDCTLSGLLYFHEGSILITGNGSLTIQSGAQLKMDFLDYQNLRISSGSKLIIKSGGQVI